MFRITKRYHCPYCNEVVVQWTNSVGPNFCPGCRSLFHLKKDTPPPIPLWAMGVLVILTLNIRFYV